MKTDNIRYGSFGLYPSYVAEILNFVKEILFYVLCNEQLNYAHYIAKYIAGKGCCISYKSHKNDYFPLSSGSERLALSFDARLIHGQLLSKLIFAQGVLQKIRFSSLAFRFVFVSKRVYDE